MLALFGGFVGFPPCGLESALAGGPADFSSPSSSSVLLPGAAVGGSE